MNVTEATLVNRLIDYLLGDLTTFQELVGEEAAREVSARLAERAHATLSAGHYGAEVRARWPVVERLP